MSLEQEIVRRIQEAHPGAAVEMQDLTGTADHWQATIVSATFEGQSPLARQRSIYAALRDLMHGERAPIHALTLKTLTPAQAATE
jgi:acid stress-induced BolA-like protein IbaG/YrbA